MSNAPGPPAGPGQQPPPRRQPHEVIVAAVGVVVTLFGLSFATVAAFELARGGDGTTALETYLGLIALFIGLSIWGARLAWTPLRLPPVSVPDLNWRPRRRQAPISTPKPPATLDDDDRARQILRLAEREHGRVTTLEVAAHCSLTADEAKALLDRLAARKVAQLHVSEGGVLVYVFPRYLSRAARNRLRRDQASR